MPTLTASSALNDSLVRSSASYDDHPRVARGMVLFTPGVVIPGTPRLFVSRSVLAEIEFTADGVVITAPTVDEDGFGTSTELAYLDFLTSLRDRYLSLMRNANKLSEQDRHVLAQLRSTLTEVNPD